MLSRSPTPAAYDRIKFIACELGERFRKYGAACEDDLLAASSNGARIRWFAPSLSTGAVGIALACGLLDKCFPDDDWKHTAHHYMKMGVEAAGWTSLSHSLFSGLAGIGFVATLLSEDGSQYQRLLRQVDAAMATSVSSLTYKLKKTNGCPVADFDVVSGASGILLYYVSKPSLDGPHAAVSELVEALAHLLTRRAEFPAWHTPPDQMTPNMRSVWRDGCLNCGMAHGITGVLAALSLAWIAGAQTAMAADAIHTASRWLVSNSSRDEWGPNWPVAFSLGDSQTSPKYSRSAWCYGSPGICRSLWLAGQAVKDTSYIEFARSVWNGFLGRPRSKWQVYTPSFCHGLAGILQIAMRFNEEDPTSTTTSLIHLLLEEIISGYDPVLPFCFSDVQPDGERLNRPGVLEGAAGILLVLLTSLYGHTNWDRAFALA